MQLNYTALVFLIASFGFAYLMKNYKLKFNVIWLICAVFCAGMYILIMFMGGQSLLDAALGLTLLSIAVFILNEKGEERNCCLTRLPS